MRKGLGIVWGMVVGVAVVVAPAPGHASKAKPAPPAPPAPAASADSPAAEGPKLTPVKGPRQVELGHELQIDLPAGFLYLDPAQAAKFMESLGNLQNQDLLGVVAQPDSSWIVTIRYTEEGYVKDDEAQKMDADEILKAIREGTDEANKEREQKGFKPVHLLGWSEPPRYARDRHQLVWGIRGKSDDAPDEVVNYNTRVLGRAGFASLNLIDAAGSIGAAKPAVASLLAATHYKPGARYEDFDKKKDRVAEYGLAALVVGGAGAAALKLVKIGLLAKFGGKILVLLIALKKGIILLVVAAFAFVKRIFGGKKAAASANAPAPTVADESPLSSSPALSTEPGPLSAPVSGVEQDPAERHPGGKDPT